MKIYRLSQTENNGWDTHDSCVVYANNEEEARTISPSEFYKYHDNNWYFQYNNGTEKIESYMNDWVSDISKIKVEYIGSNDEIIEPGLILASFNAG